MSARLTEGTRFALTVQDATADAAGWHRRMLDMFVEQELAMGHRLTARLRTMQQGAEGPTRPELALDYAVPVGVSGSRRRDAGGLEGVVVDAASGAGIADLPVRVGGPTAVTDARGRWALAGVIMDNPLALMQIRRLARETGANRDQRYIGAHQIPDWEAVALAWIERGVDPDAGPNSTRATG